MKLKKLVACIALAYSSLSAQTLTQQAFENSVTYKRSNFLSYINASSAYAKDCPDKTPCTGKNSIIAILDSGIDKNNIDLTSKIIASQDFARIKNGVWDTIGHGTHVAGIAAGNSSVIRGVAFDSKILNVKITDKDTASITTDLGGPILWSVQNGADVINLSMNTKWSSPLSLLPNTNNFYYTRQTMATSNGQLGEVCTVTNSSGKCIESAKRYPLLYSINSNLSVAASLKETVIVIAAGNDGSKYPGQLSTMATETLLNTNVYNNVFSQTKNQALAAKAADTGKLVWNGQVLVVGNWDPVKNIMAPNSNQAGSVCRLAIDNVCQDKYKMSDFFILAPGTDILSYKSSTFNPKIMTGQKTIDITGSPIPAGTTVQSGTSMAAPVVSGAVAIIHQLWPQMTGSNIVRLLLQTADKTIANYNPNIMGQGLLDLKKATGPIGNLGIPTTGRLTGPKAMSVAPVLLTTGSASTNGLGGVLTVDDYQRDFYLKGKSFTGYIRQAEFKPAQAAMPYLTRNNYTQFNNYTDRFTAAADGYEVALYRDTESSMFQLDIPVWADTKFVTGVFTEQMTWLGNMTNSFAGGGNNRPSTTHFSGLNFNKELHYGINTFGSIMHGITWTSSNSANIKNIEPVLSYTWNFGAEYKLPTSSIGAMVYQPVSVYKANADLTAPVGLDNEFNVVQNSRINLAADTKETRAGIFYKTKNFVAFIEHRQNFQGQYNVSNNAVGFNYSAKF